LSYRPTLKVEKSGLPTEAHNSDEASTGWGNFRRPKLRF